MILRRAMGMVLVGTMLSLPAQAQEDTRRVASTALCGDQLLLTLLPPARIAALSAQAVDPGLSDAAARAQGLPVLPADAEGFLWAGADIVVGSDRGDSQTLSLLRRLGVTVVRMPPTNSFADAMEQLRSVSTVLGAAEVGQALASDNEQQLARLLAERPADPPLAAYYRPDGGSSGQGTFMNEALTLSGYRNLAAEVGQSGWGRLDLETLVLHPPTALITAYFDRPSWSLRHKFSHHPLFRRLAASRPTIALPGSLVACSGWPLIKGIAFLAAARPPAGDHHD